jgi:hypothetical protein
MKHPLRHRVLSALLPVLGAAFSLLPASGAEVSIQPGPGANDGSDTGGPEDGKDAALFDPAIGVVNSGATDWLAIFNSPCNVGQLNGFLRFDTENLPKTSISKVEVRLYCQVYFNGAGSPWTTNPVVGVARVLEEWDEMTVSSEAFPASSATTLDPKTITVTGGTGSPFVEFEDWLSFDITDLYLDWIAGVAENHGIAFRVDNEYCANGNLLVAASSDHADASKRPMLVVTTTETSGPKASIRPVPRFPPTKLGRKSASQVVRIRNAGGEDLLIASVSAAGRAAKDFLIRPPSKAAILPGATSDFKMQFKPRARGMRRAFLIVKSNAPSARVAVSGKCVE